MIPGGFLCEKLGVRRVFSIFMVLLSVFTGFIGLAGSIFQLKACRLAVGLTEGPMAVGMPTTINNWFPAREKGLATGIFIASSKFGPLVVPIICALIIQQWGWREIFFIFAVPGVILGIIWYFMVANQPAKSPFCSLAEAQYIANDVVVNNKKSAEAKPYKLWWLDKIIRAKKIDRLDTNIKLFLSWNMVGSALGYFFMVAITTTMMTWIPTYLVTVKKFAIMKMAFASSAPFAGTVIGNMIGGWLSDNVFGKRRKPLMLITALATSIAMYSLIYSPEDPYLLGGLLFVSGLILSLGFSGFVVYPMGLATKEKFPIATSITNTLGQLGGFCAPLLVGMLLDKYNWDIVFTTLAGGCIICFLIVLTLVEPVDEPVARQK
jgi:MFS transporter, ACS family, glucarate transporter